MVLSNLNPYSILLRQALLHSSHLFHEAAHKMAAHGICTGDVTIDVGKMMENKSAKVEGLTGGIEYLCKKYEVSSFSILVFVSEPIFIGLQSDKSLIRHCHELTGELQLEFPIAGHMTRTHTAHAERFVCITIDSRNKSHFPANMNLVRHDCLVRLIT